MNDVLNAWKPLLLILFNVRLYLLFLFYHCLYSLLYYFLFSSSAVAAPFLFLFWSDASNENCQMKGWMCDVLTSLLLHIFFCCVLFSFMYQYLCWMHKKRRNFHQCGISILNDYVDDEKEQNHKNKNAAVCMCVCGSEVVSHKRIMLTHFTICPLRIHRILVFIFIRF